MGSVIGFKRTGRSLNSENSRFQETRSPHAENIALKLRPDKNGGLSARFGAENPDQWIGISMVLLLPVGQRFLCTPTVSLTFVEKDGK